MAHKGEIPWHESSHPGPKHKQGGRRPTGIGGCGGRSPPPFISTFLDGSFGPKYTGKQQIVLILYKFGWIFGNFPGPVKVHLKNFHLFPYLRRECPPVLKMRSYSIQLLNCANQREDFFHKIFILPDEQHATVDQHQICGKCDLVVVFLMVMVVVRRCQLC